jgi:SAM-dependent methyltransferase
MNDQAVKQQVRQFYDQVGWQMVSDGMYQNARYEDLRPVAREYVHRCHLRVNRYLKPGGRLLLDAGSGPIQYPEYLTYSQGYAHRVCVDISLVALHEARRRIGEHGLYVVADVANLPFKPGVFEGVVSLHTLHHLPPEDHERAYLGFYRVMAPGGSAVVVNGWTRSPLMQRLGWLVKIMQRLPGRRSSRAPVPEKTSAQPTGTFIQKFDPDWLRQHLSGKMAFEVHVWRSVNVQFLRAVIHPWLGGRMWLRLLFWLEERYPVWFGEQGQYPLIIIRKSS